MFETALEPGELITAIKFPIPLAAGYAKIPNEASRFALVGVFAAKFETGTRVAVTGASPAVFRVPAFEMALSRRFEPEAMNGHGIDASGLSSDIHAEAAFRAHLITVMGKRAVATALALA
jgi:carbon-monoxide dehydrogenase medium subunit